MLMLMLMLTLPIPPSRTKTICTDPTNMLNYKQHEQSRKNQVGCARRVRWPYD